jgi:rhamnosyltransferase
MANETGVIAVIVTYNPDLNVLGRLIDKSTPQVDAVVLVDNGDGKKIEAWLTQAPKEKVTLLALGDNLGIATAQNAGIKWARSKGAKQVLIFDHDSDPPSNLVARLQSALIDLEKTDKKVAAVGPRYVDKRRQESDTLSPFVRFDWWRLRRCSPPSGTSYVSVDFLISSGSLIPMKALEAVGGMEDCLFIDNVDIEWGLRARYAGWSIYGVWDIVMEHSLGDQHTVVMGREFAVHSPLRHYYLIRNVVWLCLQPWLFFKWKFVLAHNGLKKFLAYSFIMPKPMTHFRYMCLGFWHGLKGRMGKY